MEYLVVRPFNNLGVFQYPGEVIACDAARAEKLRSMRLIGNMPLAKPAETATMQGAPEKATNKTATKKAKK